MHQFHTRAELHYSREIGLYIAFGLRVYHRRRLLLHIPDVFYRRRHAVQFVRLCNREQPALAHVWDILEDAI